jgi:hypothetical protein
VAVPQVQFAVTGPLVQAAGPEVVQAAVWTTPLQQKPELTAVVPQVQFVVTGPLAQVQVAEQSFEQVAVLSVLSHLPLPHVEFEGSSEQAVVKATVTSVTTIRIRIVLSFWLGHAPIRSITAVSASHPG